MATLDQLKTRIILEVDRDDLGAGGEAAQALVDAYGEAIDHYSSEEFWFNRASASANTVGGSAALSMPAGIRFAHSIARGGEALQKVSLSEIQHRTETGVPSHWAQSGGAIQLWPIPDAAYAITVHGLASTGIPTNGGESNIWTSEACHLIVARSKVALFRIFKEFDAMQAAQAEETEALSRLRSETRRRGASPLRSDVAASNPKFDIVRGS